MNAFNPSGVNPAAEALAILSGVTAGALEFAPFTTNTLFNGGWFNNGCVSE